MAKKYFVNSAPFIPTAQFLLPTTLTKNPSTSRTRPLNPSGFSLEPLQPLTRDSNVPPGAEDLSQLYDDWLSPSPTSINSIPPSPLAEIERKGEGVDWEDVRIQSYIGEERLENQEYMGLASGIVGMIAMSKAANVSWRSRSPFLLLSIFFPRERPLIRL
jgi:hypothetical protein